MVDSTSLKILVVDDHFLARQAVTESLQDAGVANIQTAENGRVAMVALADAHKAGRPFDAMFLDWNMPEMDGMDVLTQCRSDHTFDKMAIVMVTVQSEQADVLAAVKAGATGYLIKPVTKLAIGKKLDEVLSWIAEQRAAS